MERVAVLRDHGPADEDPRLTVVFQVAALRRAAMLAHHLVNRGESPARARELGWALFRSRMATYRRLSAAEKEV